MKSSVIRNELEVFQTAVQKLGTGVGKGNSLWQDEKFRDLSAGVSEIASLSRNVILAGEKCCTSIDRFEKVAAERY